MSPYFLLQVLCHPPLSLIVSFPILSQLRYIYFILMLVLNNPTLDTIYYRSDSCQIGFSLQLKRHFRIAYQTNIICTKSILAYPSTLINSYSHEEYFDQQVKYFRHHESQFSYVILLECDLL